MVTTRKCPNSTNRQVKRLSFFSSCATCFPPFRSKTSAQKGQKSRLFTHRDHTASTMFCLRSTAPPFVVALAHWMAARSMRLSCAPAKDGKTRLNSIFLVPSRSRPPRGDIGRAVLHGKTPSRLDSGELDSQTHPPHSDSASAGPTSPPCPPRKRDSRPGGMRERSARPDAAVRAWSR